MTKNFVAWRPMWWCRAAIVAGCVMALSSKAWCNDETASQVFATFVARLNHDCPVTGKFVIETQRDMAVFAAVANQAKKDAAARGLTVNDSTVPQEKWHCRWSYDKSRELLETLDTISTWECFYSTQEQILSGVGRGNFNIMGPRPPSIVRPASFYFFIGSRRWSDFPVDKNIAFGETEEPGTIGLVISEDRLQILLAVDAESRRLKRAVFKFDGKVVGSQEVETYIDGGRDQAFPASATLTLYFNDKVIKVDKLTTESVEFPETQAKIEAAFAMELPAGTKVYDLLLEKNRVLREPTPVAEILSVGGED